MTSILATAVFPMFRLFAAVLMLNVACQPVDMALDCNTICRRYKTCFNGTYDVAACADRCRASAAKNSSYATSVNRCEACIDDRACASATFNCAGDCSNVVP